MNLAIFTDGFYPQIGGITTALINHINYLAENNHNIILFAPKHKELKNEIQLKNTKIIRIPSFSSLIYREQKISFPNIFKVIKILKKYKIDIIHIQSPGSIGIAGCLSAKLIKKPLIGTYHTLVSEFAVYFSLLKNKKNKNFFRDYNFLKDLTLIKNKEKYKIRKSLIWKFTISIYNNCDLVLAPSPEIIKELKKQKLKSNSIYLSNGLNLNKFNPKKISDSSKMKILHVGRLSYEKNVDVLIFSIKKIIKQYPNIVFDIIGEGPAEDYLKKIAKKLKLQNNINFLGYIPRENLPRIYNSHDIFITASTMETQGLVILEAMASGLPIVAVNKYAIPNLVHHNENGFLAEPGDSNEISKFVIQLIKNKKLRKEFGKNSFELSKKHDLVEIVKKMEEIYKKAIVKNSFIQSLKSSSFSQLQPQF